MIESMPAWLLVAIKSLVLLIIVVTLFAYTMLAERKVLAYMQLRVGPNKVGPWGLLQPAADAVKMIFKEDLTPRSADPVIYRLAPFIAVFTSLLAYAVIPFSQGAHGPWSIANVNAGILYVFAITSIGVYGVSLAGWASGSKYPLLGSVRATAQMISYELAMTLSVIGVVLQASTTSLTGIVDAQSRLWFIVPQLLGFCIYVITAVAETNRVPFDLVEAESELVAGFHTEYSGLRFGLFFIAEYINMITVSCLATLLFLGGWNGPGAAGNPWLGLLYFVIKVFAFLFLYIWLRGTLPRLRYDRLMAFGWKVLLPLATVNLLATAVVVALWY